MPVTAQDLEEVVVTGSRIARPDYVSASPIVSLGQERFEQTASNTAESVLDSMPQFVPSFGSASNNPGNSGQANVSLRGLPTTATLVLVDGRRLVPANGTGVADLNMVPPALIESVEVVTGGASAVYGSDAVAGVVNLKLKRDFHGVEFNASGGVTDQGDGGQYDFGLTAGTKFADGRGSIAGYVGYSERDLVTQADRNWSRYALQYVGAGKGNLGPKHAYIATGSPTIAEGTATRINVPQTVFDELMARYGYASTPPPSLQAAFGFNDDGTLFTTGTSNRVPRPGDVANFRGYRDPKAFNTLRYGYNTAPWNALQLPFERTSLFVNGDFDLAASANLYWQALYSDRTVSLRLAPTPLISQRAPVTNPYIPADLAFLLANRTQPGPTFSYSRRLTELGPRVADNEYATYQATLGSRGDLAAGWKYDAYLQTGETKIDEYQQRNALLSKVRELVFAPDGGVALCGGFNPFVQNGISPDCARYISADGVNRTNVQQQIAEVTFDGPLWSMPAGEVHAVVGAMYKRDEFGYQADPNAEDIAGFNPAKVLENSDDHNLDLYAELSLPLLRDEPWARSLEAVLGYRTSDYALAGRVDAYKAELLYEPVEALRLRGSYQHAVRAPSIYELYLPLIGPDVEIDEDPCSFNSSAREGKDRIQVAQLCAAQGIPLSELDTYIYSDLSVDGLAGGNPALKPEDAETYTAGFVVTSQATSRWLSNLQVSVDWYRIEVKNAIDTLLIADAVARCYDRQYNPDFSPGNTYCSTFQRDPATGFIVNALEIFRNIAVYRTSGIDLQATWKIDAGPGSLGLQALIAYVDSYERTAGPDVPPNDMVGIAGNTVGGTLPRWKWTLRADYDWSGVDAGVEWRHIDSLHDVQFTSYEIPAYDYLSAFVSAQFDGAALAGLTLSAGVENITNKEPPIYPNYVQANTDTSQYDTLGRRYYVRAKYRF